MRPKLKILNVIAPFLSNFETLKLEGLKLYRMIPDQECSISDFLIPSHMTQKCGQRLNILIVTPPSLSNLLRPKRHTMIQNGRLYIAAYQIFPFPVMCLRNLTEDRDLNSSFSLMIETLDFEAR